MYIILDEDMVNQINNENWAEYLDTQSMKNKILGMSNVKKKQALYTKHFGIKEEPSDEYLTKLVF